MQTGVECSGARVERSDHPWRSAITSECSPTTYHANFFHSAIVTNSCWNAV